MLKGGGLHRFAWCRVGILKSGSQEVVPDLGSVPQTSRFEFRSVGRSQLVRHKLIELLLQLILHVESLDHLLDVGGVLLLPDPAGPPDGEPHPARPEPGPQVTSRREGDSRSLLVHRSLHHVLLVLLLLH